MTKSLGLVVKNAVANSNGNILHIKEIVKGLELVEEARKEVINGLARTGVDALIKAVNNIKYGGVRYLGNITSILAQIESEGQRAVLQEREVLLAVLEGLAEREVCKHTYDSYTRERLSDLIQNTIKRIVEGPPKYELPEKPPKGGIGISYYAPW